MNIDKKESKYVLRKTRKSEKEIDFQGLLIKQNSIVYIEELSDEWRGFKKNLNDHFFGPRDVGNSTERLDDFNQND